MIDFNDDYCHFIRQTKKRLIWPYHVHDGGDDGTNSNSIFNLNIFLFFIIIIIIGKKGFPMNIIIAIIIFLYGIYLKMLLYSVCLFDWLIRWFLSFLNKKFSIFNLIITTNKQTKQNNENRWHNIYFRIFTNNHIADDDYDNQIFSGFSPFFSIYSTLK